MKLGGGNEREKYIRERISTIEEERNIRRSEIIYSQWYLMNSGIPLWKKEWKRKEIKSFRLTFFIKLKVRLKDRVGIWKSLKRDIFFLLFF